MTVAGGMAASLEFPFTSSQWKELQRQALIFKYMMASLPVPPDLLFPTIRNPSVAAASNCPRNHFHIRFFNLCLFSIMGVLSVFEMCLRKCSFGFNQLFVFAVGSGFRFESGVFKQRLRGS